jgi:transposase
MRGDVSTTFTILAGGSMKRQSELLVALDVGGQQHSVILAREHQAVEEFEITHDQHGFGEFFTRIERIRQAGETVWVIVEGAGGWLRPLDQQILQKNYRLLAVQNRKMARFREIFAGAAKTDRLDAKRACQLLSFHRQYPSERAVCEPVVAIPEVNRRLRLLSRYRRQLVAEKQRLIHRLRAHLQAVAPGLIAMTKRVEYLRFLRFLSSRPCLSQLARMRPQSLLKIRGIGPQRCRKIQQWQKQVCWGQDADWIHLWVHNDIQRFLQLHQQVQQLEEQLGQLGQESTLYGQLRSIPGFGPVHSSELAGEIGTLKRFATSDSLALYLGVAPIEHSSGRRQGQRRAKLVNRRAKNALCQAVNHHRNEVDQSRRYYQRKYQEKGQRHTKAIRALARHMVRVIWSMAKNNRHYILKEAA